MRVLIYSVGVSLTRAGSLARHSDTNEQNDAEYRTDDADGGTLLGTNRITFIGGRSACGGLPYTISKQVIPNDHISAYPSS